MCPLISYSSLKLGPDRSRSVRLSFLSKFIFHVQGVSLTLSVVLGQLLDGKVTTLTSVSHGGRFTSS